MILLKTDDTGKDGERVSAMRNPTVSESVYAPARNGGMELVRYAGGPEAVIPASVQDAPVTSVGPRAFSDTPVVSVELPEGLLSVGREAFSGCTRLREIRLPASLREIGSSAFLRCSALSSFSLPENHPAAIYFYIMRSVMFIRHCVNCFHYNPVKNRKNYTKIDYKK